MKYLQSLLLVLLLIVSVQCRSGNKRVEKRNKTVLINVSCITMTGDLILTGKAVVINGEKIEQIIDKNEITNWKDYNIIDGENKYLIPGMIDMHMHLLDENDLAVNIANGITTVRCLGEYPDPQRYPNSWRKDAFFTTTLEVKEKVENGQLLGPRIFTSSPIIDGYPPVYGDLHLTTPVKSSEEAEKIVLESIEAGYDFIKIYFNLPEDIYEVIIQTAGKYDKKVIGHVPYAVSLERALEDMYSIEHLTGYYDYDTVGSKIDYYAKLTEQKKVWHCPTINALKHILPLDEPLMIEHAAKQEWKYFSPRVKQNMLEAYGYAADKFADNPGTAGYFLDYFIYDLMIPLHEAGVDFLVGTDSPLTLAGFGYFEELEMLSRCSLSNYEILKAATYNGAACLEKLDLFGTIEQGKAADLVLLDANPLEDIGNVQKISGVMVKGEWFDRKALDKLLKEAEKKYR